MVGFLDDIEQLVESGSISVYIQHGTQKLEIEALLKKAGVYPLPDNLSQLVVSARNGAALFWGDMRKCLVLPPFPLNEEAIFSGYVTKPLRQLVTNDFLIGLVLVHLGSYAIGICKGEKLISSKVGTGLIHGRHKKGGSSQQRFQRHRENQIREFLDRVCLHIREHFENNMQSIDYIVYGGPYQTILLLQKRCQILQSLEERVLTSITVPTLRQRILETSINRIWSSSVIDWQEE
jgi:peptide subunit release factor 1 (eRF1)